MRRAVVTVIGHDTVGIIAKVSNLLSSHSVNVLEISQSVLSDLFAMVMLCDTENSPTDFSVLTKDLDDLGTSQNLNIRIMHDDIFQSMHRI